MTVKIKNLDNKGLIIKFIDPKYVDSFLDGEVHFSSFKYFKELEEDGTNHGIPDPNEGEVVYNPTSVSVCVEGKKLDMADNKVSIKRSLEKEDIERYGIASFTFLSLKDFEQIEHDETRKIVKYKLTKKQLKELSLFNKDERVPVVMLFKSLKDTISKYNDIEDGFIHARKVEYYSENELHNKLLNLNDYLDLMFMKREKYSSQHEYRIVMDLSRLDTKQNFYYEEFSSITSKVTMGDLENMELVLSYM